MPATNVPNVLDNIKKFDISNIAHPSVQARRMEWRKWRLTYEGGVRFIIAYLQQFTNREDESEYKQRKRMTYCPAFAKNALKRVRNTVFNRAREIVRIGGPKSYQLAVSGKDGGVDRSGSSMNYFMGSRALEELLKMSIVGIYVDMPPLSGPKIKDKGNKRPYVYLYHAEQIRSWTWHPENPTEFTSVLLTDSNFTYEESTNLPIGEAERYRLLTLRDTPEGPRVFVKFYNKDSEVTNAAGEIMPEVYGPEGNYLEYEEQVGNLTKIPFILCDIGTSLLADVANYQIAHMNIASGDIWYVTRSNFPFYTEQYDPKANSPYLRNELEDREDAYNRFASTVTTTNTQQIVVGPTKGRKYPVGTERPGFISPPSEPLMASMAKQEQIKKEISELVDMTLQSLTGQTDQESTLCGLNYIAYVLQWAENKIAEFWSMYEGSDEIAAVIYPEAPEITDPKDIQAEVLNLLKLIDTVPQILFKKELLKKVARLKLHSEASLEDLQAIYDEIDESDVVLGDPANISQDVINGLVSTKTASEARGYPKGESKAAEDDHAARLKRVQDAQTPRTPDGTLVESKGIDPKGIDPEQAQARGLTDLSTNDNAGKSEKQDVKDTTNMKELDDPERGKGKS